MAESQYLAIPQVSDSQNNKHITVNNAVSALEAALGSGKLVNSSVGAGPWNLTEAQFAREDWLFVPSGGSANFDLVTKGEINAINTSRFFAVYNADTTYTCTVKSDAAGTTVAVPPGYCALLFQTHDDIIALSSFKVADGVTTPYDIGCFVPGEPGAAGLVFQYVATRTILFEDDFAGSRGKVGTLPTATAAFDVLKNAVSVGDISISTGGVFTFTTDSGALSLAPGDVLTITAPSPADSTLADISFVFKARAQ